MSKTTTTQHTEFKSYAEVRAYIEQQEAEHGGAWAFDTVFGTASITRADIPSKLPDHFISAFSSNNLYYFKGEWHDFSEARKIREQNRGLIQD
jgi:hypothetical protein